jgi:hypothetical protein
MRHHQIHENGTQISMIIADVAQPYQRHLRFSASYLQGR